MVAGEGSQVVLILPAEEEPDKVTLEYVVYAPSNTNPWFGYTFDFDKPQ